MRKLPAAYSLLILALILVVAAVTTFLFAKNGMQPINQDLRAVERVSKLPEVIEFKEAVEQGGRSTFSVELAGENFIQVLERFSDHQTTFGWYRYDPEDGTLYKQDIATDTWEEVP